VADAETAGQKVSGQNFASKRVRDQGDGGAKVEFMPKTDGIIEQVQLLDAAFCGALAAGQFNARTRLPELHYKLFEILLAVELPTGRDEIIQWALLENDPLLELIHSQCQRTVAIGSTGHQTEYIDRKRLPRAEVADL
jgi:hypothetical protein